MNLKQIWSSNMYMLRKKLRLCNTLVKPLLYGSEPWKMNEDNRKLDTFFSSAFD